MTISEIVNYPFLQSYFGDALKPEKLTVELRFAKNNKHRILICSMKDFLGYDNDLAHTDKFTLCIKEEGCCGNMTNMTENPDYLAKMLEYFTRLEKYWKKKESKIININLLPEGKIKQQVIADQEEKKKLFLDEGDELDKYIRFRWSYEKTNQFSSRIYKHPVYDANSPSSDTNFLYAYELFRVYNKSSIRYPFYLNTLIGLFFPHSSLIHGIADYGRNSDCATTAERLEQLSKISTVEKVLVISPENHMQINNAITNLLMP